MRIFFAHTHTFAEGEPYAAVVVGSEEGEVWNLLVSRGVDPTEWIITPIGLPFKHEARIISLIG
jgi:hypothetical protein